MSRKFHWSMLTILVVLTAGLLLANQASQAPQAPAASQAQNAMGTHPEFSPEAHLQMLTEKLNLTDDQKAKVKPILESQAQQMKAVHEDASLSQEQRKSKMKAIHESTHDQINAVLTPEQQAKWKQMRQEHKGMKEGEMEHK